MTIEITEVQPIDTAAVIASFGDLPTLAPVAVEVLRLADDDRASLEDIAEAISRDPGLAGQLLRVANSPLYGMGGEITSLSRAAAILGLRTVKLLSLSFAVVKPVEGDADDALIWRRTLAGSALARTIAASLEPRLADEAFIGALLANLGRVALLSDPNYLRAHSADGGWLAPMAEEALFGVTSDDVTARILAGWGLPAMLSEAIRRRSAPGELSGQYARVAAILAAADAAASFITAADEDAPGALDEWHTCAAEHFALQPEAADQLLSDSQAALEEIGAMFQAPAPNDAPVTELLLRAREGLARLSLDVVAALSQEQGRDEQLANENQRLAAEATTDSLTGLPNRRAFDEKMETYISARMRHPQPGLLGLLVMDLDRFKSINDTWGHQVGDDVLRAVAGRLRSYARVDEVVARMGGEEFGVILPITDRAEIELAAERLRRAVSNQPFDTSAGPLAVTISVGIALVKDVDRNTPSWLYEQADAALYQAKDEGRNCIRFGT